MNDKIYIDENNNELDLDILFPFEVEKYDNIYIAYTLNDDGESEEVQIYISKIAYLNDRIQVLSIGKEEKKDVMKKYNEIIHSLEEI